MEHRVGGASHNIRIYEFIWYHTQKCSQIIFSQKMPDNVFIYQPIPKYSPNILYPHSPVRTSLFLSHPLIALPPHNHHRTVHSRINGTAQQVSGSASLCVSGRICWNGLMEISMQCQHIVSGYLCWIGLQGMSNLGFILHTLFMLDLKLAID